MSLALYRRYRPETFAEVIGQEHVTEPLQQALRNGRVHHAYLFSGPRGCGKTTSARILARALNCEQGPTPQPCGTCQSCRDLARNGPGGIDVIEIDAASHGGVDDARDLRERAFFAPAAARYKIYIVDEAHMVTSAGFNALLKVVEEPPQHLKFIFATTEPEKVIGTIRSRTHHYPFRLVPPSVLRDYVAWLCEEEGARVDPGVLPLVVRAGAGSVRDSLSVLDQLIAGAGEDGVSYAMAAALLGFSDVTLLDDLVDAFAVHDGAAAFSVVERVIEGGYDPRRFVADLLERFRDLVVLDAVPDAETKRLIDRPADQLERMRSQAAAFGPAELSRSADLASQGLTEMRGATAPRLHLELICARVLLPAAADDKRSLLTRLERMERRMAIGDETPPAAPPASLPAGPSTATLPDPVPVGPATSPVSLAPPPADLGGATPAGLDVMGVRRAWPEILEAVKRRRRFTWILLSQNAQVISLDRGTLCVSLVNSGARDSFVNSGSDEVLRRSLTDVLGVDWRIECIVGPSDPTGSSSGSSSRPAPGLATSGPSGPEPAGQDQPGFPSSGKSPGRTSRNAQPADPGASERPGPTSRESADPDRAVSQPLARPLVVAPEDDVATVEDVDVDPEGLSGPELVQRELGAKIIGEFRL